MSALFGARAAAKTASRTVALSRLATSGATGPSPKIVVEYCETCAYAPRFKILSAALKKALPGVAVIADPSRRTGAFEVTLELDGEAIELWSKLETGEPASDEGAGELAKVVAGDVTLELYRAGRA